MSRDPVARDAGASALGAVGGPAGRPADRLGPRRLGRPRLDETLDAPAEWFE